MLVLYYRQLFFPGGGPAANYPVSIYPRASNVLALLFEDEQGQTPLSNPLTTNSFGEALFYAAPGDYFAELGGEVNDILIDPSVSFPVWPGLWIHTQSFPSTGWTVNHHFGVEPSVDILMNGDESIAAVEHLTNETTVIQFGNPVTGTAYLRR